MNSWIEEMADRATTFGDRMMALSTERWNHQETIRRLVDEGESIGDWRTAPGVESDAAQLIIDELEADGPLAFATVELIEKHPEFEDYFREQSGIPKKQISQRVKGLTGQDRKTAWVRFVNSVCSRIVAFNEKWDNPYHEYLAISCRAVSLDGTMRNRVGQAAEKKVRDKLVAWLHEKKLVEKKVGENEILLNSSITLKFASEPDIGFYRGTFVKKNKLIAVVEIKGGKDPAGALERIGALEKTMNETPDECWRFAILGVTTDKMNERLDKLKLSDRFDLDKLLANVNGEWDRFTVQVFKEALRIEYD